MGWVIRVGKIGFARDIENGLKADAGMALVHETNCIITSSPLHTFAQLSFMPRSTARPGAQAPNQAEKVWQNVLNKLLDV